MDASDVHLTAAEENTRSSVSACDAPIASRLTRPLPPPLPPPPPSVGARRSKKDRAANERLPLVAVVVGGTSVVAGSAVDVVVVVVVALGRVPLCETAVGGNTVVTDARTTRLTTMTAVPTSSSGRRPRLSTLMRATPVASTFMPPMARLARVASRSLSNPAALKRVLP